MPTNPHSSSFSAIYWLRREFRFRDNPALYHALANNDRVAVVYIYCPEEEQPWAPGAASRWWLHHSLQNFGQQLEDRGGMLILRQGPSLQTLKQICAELDSQTVYWNRLYEPAIVARDKFVKKTLTDDGIQVKTFNAALLKEPWNATKKDGEAYKVYTPFSKQYFASDDLSTPLEPPEDFARTCTTLSSLQLKQLGITPSGHWTEKLSQYWLPGETAALNQLQSFLQHNVLDYPVERDIPSIDGVSKLSPYLHFGEISPRQIWHEVLFSAAHFADNGHHAAHTLCVTYLKQLVWRDFAHHMLFHFPHTTERPFRQQFEHFQWDQNISLLNAWQRGDTGIPLVDAGMRELWQTGWMHNRVRMIVASLLTKNGLVNWLEGARWFWDTLVDASLANNTMGWQWTAGCGVDAAPYFRIFSPVRQGQRFDPEGEYVKQWLPELSDVPRKFIHEPWNTPDSVRVQCNFKPGKNYPLPVVDLSAGRGESLARFKALKS